MIIVIAIENHAKRGNHVKVRISEKNFIYNSGYTSKAVADNKT